MIKFQELKAMEAPELSKLLAKTREELRATRFRLGTGTEKDVRSIREMRETIARIMSLLAAKVGAKKA